MRFTTYILAIATVILTACSSDDSRGNRRDGDMLFRANAAIANGWSLSTRADGQTATPKVEAMPNTYKIDVSSFLRPDAGDTKNTAGAFLRKQPLTYVSSGTSSTWKAEDCYWPLSGSMDFIAWATSSKQRINPDNVTFNGSSDFASNFQRMEVDFGTSLDGSADILYSDLAAHATRKDAAVPFTFNHSTACVYVSLRAGDQTTIDNMGISSVAFDKVAVSGKLSVTPSQAVDYSTLTKLTSIATTPAWSDTVKVSNYHMPRFEALSDANDVTKKTPIRLSLDTIGQDRYFVPGAQQSSVIISYTINGTTRSFTYHCADRWQMALRYSYRFTVTLRKIEAGAEEEQWNTEIGGNAFEPDWNVEIGTGALESTWGEEIGGEGYEMTWRVEMSATALEAGWVSETQASADEEGWNSEIGSGAGEGNWNAETGAGANEGDWNSETGAGANEDGWNSETGAGANEDGWNSETGGSASEENWNEETGGGAFEAPWEPGDTIIIGGDPATPSGDPTPPSGE